jgi:hypothetical protein
MDEQSGQALFDERIKRTNEALAIEVVTLRAWYGSLLTAMDEMARYIKEVAIESNRPESMVRAAGGMAALDLLKEWCEQSMGTINDFTVTMADVP